MERRILNSLGETTTKQFNSSAVLYHTRWSQKFFAKRSQAQIINLQRKERPILSYVTRYNIGRCPKNSNPFVHLSIDRSITAAQPCRPPLRPTIHPETDPQHGPVR
ncbi:unnamed protein product [Tenebrio molitor]|nr:unnamed protein product [Tenebrio molitor]